MKPKIYILAILLFSSIALFGQVPDWLWAKSASGTSDDEANSVAVDASGNTYVVGWFSSPNITFGSTTLTNTGSWDMFLTKYDANGNVVWAKSVGGTNAETANAVAVDASGNIYVAGQFGTSTITFGSYTLTNEGSTDIFLAKYDVNGNVVWAKSAGGIVGDGAASVAVDILGNIYLTGSFNSPTLTFGSITLTNTSNLGNTSDLFIVKYNANGNVLWAKSASGTVNDLASSVAVDASGNTYVSGYFNSPTLTFSSTILTNAVNTGSSNDLFLAKYDASGNVIWAKSAGGTSSDMSNSIAIDVSGNLYMTGYFYSPTLAFGSYTLTNAGMYDLFLAKYDDSGNVLWAESAGGTSADEAHSVIVDASGNIYLTGLFYSPTLTFGSTTLTNEGLEDIFLAKYNSNGNVVWAKSAGGTSFEVAWSVAVNSSGNIYLAGWFGSPTLTFGSTTLTNADNSGNSADIFIAKLSTATGINELNNLLNISFYPNPAINNITIESPQQALIEIFNIQGLLIKTLTKSGNKISVDISDFTKGIYFVKVKTDEGMLVEKFTKD